MPDNLHEWSRHKVTYMLNLQNLTCMSILFSKENIKICIYLNVPDKVICSHIIQPRLSNFTFLYNVESLTLSSLVAQRVGLRRVYVAVTELRGRPESLT